MVLFCKATPPFEDALHSPLAVYYTLFIEAPPYEMLTAELLNCLTEAVVYLITFCIEHSHRKAVKTVRLLLQSLLPNEKSSHDSMPRMPTGRLMAPGLVNLAASAASLKRCSLLLAAQGRLREILFGAIDSNVCDVHLLIIHQFRYCIVISILLYR